MNASPPEPHRFWRVLGGPSKFVRNIKVAQRPFAYACWLIVAVLVLWDIYLLIDNTDDNTWSEVMRHASAHYPILPWVLGTMAAHLFHHRDDLRPIVDAHAASTIMGTLTVILVLVGFLDFRLPWPVGVTALLGIVAGYLLWPKKRTQVWKW